jgi:hypothetical protein
MPVASAQKMLNVPDKPVRFICPKAQQVLLNCGLGLAVQRRQRHVKFGFNMEAFRNLTIKD